MSKIVEIAKTQIGQTESPANTNKTKYGQWFGVDGVPWCGIFASWCYYMAGFPLGNIGFKLGFAGCQTAFAHFTKKGEITKNPQPGDLVLFDWNGDGRYDHVGIFVEHHNRLSFLTIEGNTSEKNNSNGGTVMQRVRYYGEGVIFIHPKVLDKIS